MVDTVPFTSVRLNSELILKALLGGISTRLDQQTPL